MKAWFQKTHRSSDTKVRTILTLIDEAVSSIAARPTRSLMTMAGTILGIASFVAIVGLTTTASGQISSKFNELEATQIVVSDVATAMSGQPGYSFPVDAGAKLRALNGVIDAGIYFQVSLAKDGNDLPIATTPAADDEDGKASVTLYGAEAGTLVASDAALTSGVLLDDFHTEDKVPVAVLGASAASALGINSIETQPTVFVGNNAYSVIGVLRDSPRLPELASAVIIPSTLAIEQYGLPTAEQSARILVQTSLGAAKLLSIQAPYALRPDAPDKLGVAAPPDWSKVTGDVTTSVNSLLLALASIALFVGCLAIMNTMLVAVVERTGEIGLRQALGATPRHISAQFLAESCTIGLVGGAIGNALGIFVVLAVAVAREWTPVLDSSLSIGGMVLGLATGILAGVYPAIKAAKVEPASALQR